MLATPLWAETEADHEALRNLKALYERAAAENNPDLLKPHLHEKFSGVMVTGDEVKDFASLDAFWKDIQAQMGEGGKYSVTVKPAEKSLIMGDVALAWGTADELVITGSGREYKFSSSWTAVCVRDGAAWKILRVQATMDPIGNPFVKAAVSGVGWLAGVGGGFGGLVIGACGLAAIQALRKRRKPAGTT